MFEVVKFFEIEKRVISEKLFLKINLVFESFLFVEVLKEDRERFYSP